MVLTRAVDNRLKQLFASGEVSYEGVPFQGKGFRSLGQEAIYAAALRLSVGLGLASALIFVVGVLGLNELTKHDPYGFDVWLRSRGYAHEYDARARWDVLVRRRRSWR